MADTLFIASCERALHYRISNIDTLSRISWQLMKKGIYEIKEIPPANDYEHRKSYQQGRFSQEAELKIYQDLLLEKKREGKEE